MKNKGICYVVCVAVVEALGFAVGVMTRNGTALYADTINKPPLAPQGILFPIAWTLLYALMGIGLARVLCEDSSINNKADTTGRKYKAVVFFVVQMILNLAWCFIFFGAMNYVAALIELLVMMVFVILMMLEYMKIDRVAGLIQIPYVIWLCFATYLNAGVIALN